MARTELGEDPRIDPLRDVARQGGRPPAGRAARVGGDASRGKSDRSPRAPAGRRSQPARRVHLAVLSNRAERHLNAEVWSRGSSLIAVSVHRLTETGSHRHETRAPMLESHDVRADGGVAIPSLSANLVPEAADFLL